MTIKNKKIIKTALFASLITALIIPFSGMSFAETNEQISDTIVDDRTWLKNASEQNKHDAFMAYVNHDMSDNGWNKAMLKENIRNYNIETKIGHDVNGYELVALQSQRDILNGKYNPTIAQQKFQEWTLSQYNVPQNISDIDDRIEDIVGKNHVGHAKQLVDSLNIMADHGNVGATIYQSDPVFWATIGNKSLCGYIEGCDPNTVDFSSVGDRLPNDQTIEITSQVGTSAIHSIGYNADSMIIPVTTYYDHKASMYITYNPCATSGSTCNAYRYHEGTGIKTSTEAGPSHVQDYYLWVSMTAWDAPSNSVIVVETKVTGPVSGGTLSAYDTDGNVLSEGSLYNPNASAESQVYVQLKSFAYT